MVRAHPLKKGKIMKRKVYGCFKDDKRIDGSPTGTHKQCEKWLSANFGDFMVNAKEFFSNKPVQHYFAEENEVYEIREIEPTETSEDFSIMSAAEFFGCKDFKKSLKNKENKGGK